MFSASVLIKNTRDQRNLINQLQDIVNKLHEIFDLHFIPLEPTLLYVLDPEKNDINALRKLMKDGNYASHNTYQIKTNTIRPPNLLTGCEGDANKYCSITTFFNNWRDNLYFFLEAYCSLIVHIQSGCTCLENPRCPPAEAKIS